MAFTIFQPNKKAKSAEVNANFAFISGSRLIAINASTGAAFGTFDIGDLTAITNGSLVGDLNARSGNDINVYNASGSLIGSVSYDQLLNLQSASETAEGTAELATQAETDAGTDDLRIVTPLKLKTSVYNSRELIATTVASNDATVEFTGLSSSYSSYEVDFEYIVPVTDQAGLICQFSDDGGSTFKNASYLSGNTNSSTSNALTTDTNNATRLTLCAFDGDSNKGISNASSKGLNGTIKIFNPSSTIKNKQAAWNVIYVNGGGFNYTYYSEGYGQYNGTTTAINAIRFKMSTSNSDVDKGNISTGTFKLYGIK